MLLLAIFSDIPAFAEPLYIGRPNIGDRHTFFCSVADIFDPRWLTNQGRYVTELEQRIAELLGVRHYVTCCNGTVALEIGALSTGLDDRPLVHVRGHRPRP